MNRHFLGGILFFLGILSFDTELLSMNIDALRAALLAKQAKLAREESGDWGSESEEEESSPKSKPTPMPTATPVQKSKPVETSAPKAPVLKIMEPSLKRMGEGFEVEAPAPVAEMTQEDIKLFAGELLKTDAHMQMIIVNLNKLRDKAEKPAAAAKAKKADEDFGESSDEEEDLELQIQKEKAKIVSHLIQKLNEAKKDSSLLQITDPFEKKRAALGIRNEVLAGKFDKILGSDFGKPVEKEAVQSKVFAELDLDAFREKVAAVLVTYEAGYAAAASALEKLKFGTGIRNLRKLQEYVLSKDRNELQKFWDGLDTGLQNEIDKDLAIARTKEIEAKEAAQTGTARKVLEVAAREKILKEVITWNSLKPDEKMKQDPEKFREEIFQAQAAVMQDLLTVHVDLILQGLITNVKDQAEHNKKELNRITGKMDEIPSDAYIAAQVEVFRYLEPIMLERLKDRLPNKYATLGMKDYIKVPAKLARGGFMNAYKRLVKPAIITPAPATAAPMPVPTTTPAESAAVPVTSTINGKDVTAFAKMKKNGVPDGAIGLKMGAAGFTPAEIDKLLAGEFDGTPATAAPTSAPTTIPVESPAAPTSSTIHGKDVAAFVKMKKSGVPDIAIQHKMRTAGFTPEEIDKLLAGDFDAAPSAAPALPLSVVVRNLLLESVQAADVLCINVAR